MSSANQVIYELKVSSDLTSITDSQKRLISYKEEVIRVEAEIKKLKASTKGNADEAVKSAGQLAILETKLKALRDGYQATQREATGIRGFTDKMTDSFKGALGPMESLMGKLDQLGPIGQSMSQLVGKVQGVGNAINGLGASNDKLSKGIGQVNGSVKQLGSGLDGVKGSVNGLGGGLNDIKGGLNGLHAQAATTGQGVEKLNRFTAGLGAAFGGAVLGIGALIGGLTALGVGISSSIQAYDAAIRSQRSLEVALGDSAKALVEQGDALEQLTNVEGDRINSGQAFLAQLGLQEETILRLTPAIVDFGVATGDVDGAFRAVGQTLAGGKSALSKYGIELDKSASQTERVDAVVAGLNQRFQGQAEALASVGAGSLDRWRNGLGKLEESIGGLLIRGLTPFVEGLADVAYGLGELLEPSESAADSWRAQRDEINDLERDILPLLDRYDSLSVKAELNADEQTELNTIIQSVAGTLPVAASSFDQYGRAISLSTEAARKFIEEQKNVLRYKNAEAIEEESEKLEDLQKSYDQAKRFLSEFDKALVINGQVYRRTEQGVQKLMTTQNEFGRQRYATISMQEANEVLGEAQKQFQKYSASVAGAKGVIAELSGEQTEANKKLKETEADVAAKKAKQLSDALAGQTATLEQLQQALKDANEAKADLAESDLSGIANSNKVIADLEKRIAAFTTAKAKEKKVEKDAIAERLRDINNAYALEVGLIDRAETSKLITQEQGQVLRLEKLKKFLDDRAALEREKAGKEGKVQGTEILSISGIEEEGAKVQKELDELKARIAQTEAVKVRLINLATDQAIIDEQYQTGLAAFDQYAAEMQRREKGMELSEDERTLRQEKRVSERKVLELEWRKAKVESVLKDAEIQVAAILREQQTTGVLSEERQKQLDDLRAFITQQKAILQSVTADISTASASNSKDKESPLAKMLGLDQASMEFYLGAAQALSDSLSDIFIQGAIDRNARVRDEDLAALNDKRDEYVDGLQEQLDQGQITQESFDALKEEADVARAVKEETIRKEAFQREKRLKREQAALELALELARIAATSALSGPLSAIQYGVMSGVALVRFAATVAAINRAQYAKGGQVPSGLIQGPSHAEGGIPFVVKGRDEVMEFEGSEFIVNKHSTKRFLPLLHAINGTYAKGGYVPSAKFERGGQVISLQPREDLVTTKREADERRRTVTLPTQRDDRQIIVHVSDIEAKRSRLDRTRKRVSIGG